MNIIQTEQKAMDMDLTQPEAWRDLEVTGPKTQFSFFSPVTGITQRAQKIDAGESREARDFFQRRGLNLQQHLDEVRGLDFDTARAADEKQPVELDVNAFLARQQRAIVEATVAEANELTAKECYDSYIASMESDWAKTKQEFLDAMGFRRSGKSSTSLTIAPATSTALSAPFQGQPSSLSRDMIRSAPMASGPMVATDFRLSASGQQRTPDLVARNARATLMERLSRAQTTGERVPIVGEFERIQMSIVGDQKRRGERPRSHLFVMDCWDLLSEIVHERREADTLGDEARALYLSADKPLRRRLLRGARSYYERLFTNFVIDEVRKSSRSERGRGVSYLEDVRAFIKLENAWSMHWSAKGGEYWDVAFERLDALNLFPAASSYVTHARAHAQSVRSLDSRVRRVFGDVAMAAMEIVVAKYRDLERRTSGSGNPMTENILHILSAKGSSILQFLAATETHIRPDINTRISQLEITMAKHRKIMS
eukprot:713896_1